MGNIKQKSKQRKEYWLSGRRHKESEVSKHEFM